MKTFTEPEQKTITKATANKVSLIKPTPFRLPMLKTKLKTGQPNDKYEQEADRIASQVMSMPESAIQQQSLEEKEEMIQTQALEEEEEVLQTKSFIQLQPIEEEEEEELMPKLQLQPVEEEEEMLQAKPLLQLQPEEEEEEMVQPKWIQKEECSSYGKNEMPDLQGSTQSIQISPLNHIESSGGQPLPDSSRGFFESRMGCNFENVLVHNSDSSIQMNQKLGAQAFTYGNDIYFNSGKYNPYSTAGKHLLAHELTHVVQQQPRLSKSPGFEGIRFEKQVEVTPRSDDFEKGKRTSSVPYRLNRKVLELLQRNDLLNLKFHTEMIASIYDCTKKAGVLFEPDVNYLYTISGRFSGDEILWIRVIMNKPTTMQYDWGEVIFSSSTETESGEYKENLNIEEIEAKLGSAANDIEKLDAWLQMAEYVFDGESAEKVAGLRRKLGQFSGPLLTAIDIKNKTEAGAKLIASFHRGLNIKPGGPGGVKAASSILYALGEFGQEIPVLGGVLSGYLEFLKGPEVLRKFGEGLVDLHHKRMKKALTGK